MSRAMPPGSDGDHSLKASVREELREYLMLSARPFDPGALRHMLLKHPQTGRETVDRDDDGDPA